MLLEISRRSLAWIWDREFGIVTYAPIYLLTLPGLLFLVRQRRSLAVDIGVVVSIYIAAIAIPMVNPYGWTGGWSPAARFLVPIAPLLAGAIYQAAINAPASALMLAGLQVVLSALVWQRPKLLWSEGDGTAALCAAGDWLPQCWLFPSMIRSGSYDWSVAVSALVIATAWGVWLASSVGQFRPVASRGSSVC